MGVGGGVTLSEPRLGTPFIEFESLMQHLQQVFVFFKISHTHTT